MLGLVWWNRNVRKQKKRSNGTMQTHTVKANKLAISRGVDLPQECEQRNIQTSTVKTQSSKALMNFYYRTVNANTHTRV